MIQTVTRTPVPGDFFLNRIGGVTGFFVMVGQALIGDASRYTHAGILIDGDSVLAAQPGGARYDDVSTLGEKVVWSTGRVPLTDDQRAEIIDIAASLEGTSYSFLDYLYLALHRFGIRWGWVESAIVNSKHMICSQLVDEVYRRAGIPLFSDGRLPHSVTPGDLANGLLEEW